MRDRREHVPFDTFYFERLRRDGTTWSMLETFRYIHRTDHWAGGESVSGPGASSEQTAVIRAVLPRLVRTLRVKTLVDAPCGDFSWMRLIDLPIDSYLGADILPELIARNAEEYGDARRRFVVLDLTCDPLPPADLLLCRDCLVHLSFAAIGQVLGNVHRSGVRYLLTTTFPDTTANEEIVTGDWRLLNLERPPFDFPPPLGLLNEGCTEGGGLFRDKSLRLWRVADLPHAI